MNVINFEQHYCEKIRRMLDSYLSHELAAENQQEIRQHLEKCAACAAELETRDRIRQRLREAVRSQAVPFGLEEQIRRGIRTAPDYRPLFYAVAAALILTFGGWLFWRNQSSVSGPEIALQPVTEQVRQALKIGADDHLYCVFDHGNKDRVFTVAEMTEKMGPYYELVSVARKHTPNDFTVTVAHRCQYQGREFVHLLLKNQRGHLLSLILTKKQQAESLLADGSGDKTKLLLYQGRALNFEVAGFEANAYLGFVVSDFERDQNLLIASRLAPAVHNFISLLQPV
jgi:anti-sigma factor (TIGR02949 family)